MWTINRGTQPRHTDLQFGQRAASAAVCMTTRGGSHRRQLSRCQDRPAQSEKCIPWTDQPSHGRSSLPRSVAWTASPFSARTLLRCHQIGAVMQAQSTRRVGQLTGHELSQRREPVMALLKSKSLSRQSKARCSLLWVWTISRRQQSRQHRRRHLCSLRPHSCTPPPAVTATQQQRRHHHDEQQQARGQRSDHRSPARDLSRPSRSAALSAPPRVSASLSRHAEIRSAAVMPRSLGQAEQQAPVVRGSSKLRPPSTLINYGAAGRHCHRPLARAVTGKCLGGMRRQRLTHLPPLRCLQSAGCELHPAMSLACVEHLQSSPLTGSRTPSSACSRATKV